MKQIDRALRKGIALATPELPSDISRDVLGIQGNGVQHHSCGVGDFRTNTITRQPGNTVSGHRKPPLFPSIPRLQELDVDSSREAVHFDQRSIMEPEEQVMPANLPISSTVESEPYRTLLVQLQSLLKGERDPVANMANTSALLYHVLPNVNWAGFYIWKGNELVLGPFQGQVACVRIGAGKGVCGAAAAARTTIVVPDVQAFPGHIACDSASRSEIVVPVLFGDHLAGVLDLDSPQENRFGESDRLGLESLTRLFVENTEPFGTTLVKKD